VTFARNKVRNHLEMPQSMVEMDNEYDIKPLSMGECRFCNAKADVFNIIVPAPESRIFPVILHEGKACNQFVAFYTQPGSTGCADQTSGIYKLE
jgi:hypothetical protein